MNIKILVATHKNYAMPKDDLYLPVFVGKNLHPDINHTFQGDNTGKNISAKNANYNELTAIYWGWQNLTNLDAMGLVHYRRYFSLNGKKDVNAVATRAEIEGFLQSADVLVPKRRNYYIETNESHYYHVHEHEPLDVMRKIIKDEYPEYYPAFQKVLKRTWAHMFNMFVMKRQPLDEYCTWMFEVLGKVEAKIDMTNYTPYEKRVFGFLSELMLDTWLETHSEYQVKEINYVFMEPVNWLKKGGKFLKRKIFGHGEH